MSRHRVVLVGLGLCVGLAVAGCSSPSSPAPDGGAARGGGFVGGSGGAGGTSGGAAAGHGGSSATGVGGAGGAGGADLACLATKTLACPGVDGAKAFNSTLAASDAAAMCDCIATYAGGYGSPLSCTCLDGSPGAVMAPASQAACLAQPYPPACSITVAQYIACTNLLWAKPCDAAAFVAVYQDPSCAPLETSACR